MATWTQTAVTAVMLLTCGVTGTRTHPAVTGTARSDEVQGSRVRILSPQMAHGFREGISRSPTFRRLVDAIDASDGIVYVEYGVCRSGARSCLMGSINVAGSSRILRVRIQKTQLGDKLVVSLGHELQHAIEVLGEPWLSRRPQKCGFSSGKLEFSMAVCSRRTRQSGSATRSSRTCGHGQTRRCTRSRHDAQGAMPNAQRSERLRWALGIGMGIIQCSSLPSAATSA